MFLFLSCGGCELQPQGRTVQMFIYRVLPHFDFTFRRCHINKSFVSLSTSQRLKEYFWEPDNEERRAERVLTYEKWRREQVSPFPERNLNLCNDSTLPYMLPQWNNFHAQEQHGFGL